MSRVPTSLFPFPTCSTLALLASFSHFLSFVVVSAQSPKKESVCEETFLFGRPVSSFLSFFGLLVCWLLIAHSSVGFCLCCCWAVAESKRNTERNKDRGTDTDRDRETHTFTHSCVPKESAVARREGQDRRHGGTQRTTEGAAS